MSPLRYEGIVKIGIVPPRFRDVILFVLGGSVRIFSAIRCNHPNTQERFSPLGIVHACCHDALSANEIKRLLFTPKSIDFFLTLSGPCFSGAECFWQLLQLLKLIFWNLVLTVPPEHRLRFWLPYQQENFDVRLYTATRMDFADNQSDGHNHSSVFLHSTFRTKLSMIVLPTIFYVVFVVGLVGNSTVVYVMRKVVRTYDASERLNQMLGGIERLNLIITNV